MLTRARLFQVHFVTFNAEGKIALVRQCWDQGALLKQIDVIGKSGRNWPIRDSTEQVKMIVSAVTGVKKELSAAASSSTPPPHSRGASTTAKRDPHASLELFATREERDNAPVSVISPYGGVRPRQRDISEIMSDDPNTAIPVSVVSPYAGRRPPQRPFSEILGGDDDEDDGSVADGDSYANGSSARLRSRSPSKVIPPKAGGSKKFHPVRLFDTDGPAEEEPDSPENPNRPKAFYRPHPKRYNHFDLADGSQDAPQTGTAFEELPKSKHNSQWGFSDFETPQKLATRTLPGQEARHWTLDDDEDLPETPSASRGESQAAGRQRGVGHNEGLGLYKNNLYKEDGSAFTPGPEARDLGNITNLKDRTKFFEANFTMSDVSPLSNGPAKQTVVADDRQKVVKMMESSWTTSFDDAASPQKEHNKTGTNVSNRDNDNRGIQTVGDGMGGRKAVSKDSSVSRGIQIGGDGMGGRKAGRGWSLGDEVDETPDLSRKAPGKKPGASNQTSGFWDY